MSEWELHRQPQDQIADHEYSIWCDGELVMMANSMPGEEGVLATIVAALNEMEELRRLALDWRVSPVLIGILVKNSVLAAVGSSQHPVDK